jgi:hypothetical protein
MCSGKVYCSCGAKMHASTTQRKGHEYQIYSCSNHCGIGTIPVEQIDGVVIDYLKDIFSDKNSPIIAQTIARYKTQERQDVIEFNNIVKQKVSEKKMQYDNLMNNLMNNSLPEVIASDIGKKMEQLLIEIETLKNLKPAKQKTSETITQWINSIKQSPDEEVVNKLVERIDVQKTPLDCPAGNKKTKTEINVTTTLISVLGKNGG